MRFIFRAIKKNGKKININEKNSVELDACAKKPNGFASPRFFFQATAQFVCLQTF